MVHFILCDVEKAQGELCRGKQGGLSVSGVVCLFVCSLFPVKKILTKTLTFFLSDKYARREKDITNEANQKNIIIDD